MSRHKSGTKSGWRGRDKRYRLEQNAKAAHNRRRRMRPAMENLFSLFAAPAPLPPIDCPDEVEAPSSPTPEEIEAEGLVYDEDMGLWVKEIEFTPLSETEAILADPDTMDALAEAEADIAAGDVVEIQS